MRIVVCVKLVPDTNEAVMDKQTHTLRREAVDIVMNPYDRAALELASRLKQAYQDVTVSVISMGTRQCIYNLKEIGSLGADELVLLNDPHFAGSDSLATAYILSRGIAKLSGADFIICGRQAVDGNTEQVGPALADQLGIPYATCVNNVKMRNEGQIMAERRTDYADEQLTMNLPALITYDGIPEEFRLITINEVIRAQQQEVKVLTSKDLEIETERCGLSGSATKVIKCRPIRYHRESCYFRQDEEGIRQMAATLSQIMNRQKEA